MTALQFDDETSRRVESAYLTPDVVEQRRIVRHALALRPGERVLDIGSGPGFLATEMAGEGAVVCGIDLSDSMLAMARARGTIEYLKASANDIPYPDDSFDVVVSTQVFEYIEDIPEALAEVRRVLRPGGRVLLLDTDWDSIVWHSTDEARMTRVLLAFEQHLADPHLPRTLQSSLRQAGFTPSAPEIVPMFNVGYGPDRFSAGLLELVAAFVAGRDGVTAEEAAAWAEDLRSLGDGYFFSLNRYLFLATAP